ncbi:hypothetical protein [Actinoplanes regularis]|nr:hypothetical protein [Actinoplanes regularis]
MATRSSSPPPTPFHDDCWRSMDLDGRDPVDMIVRLRPGSRPGNVISRLVTTYGAGRAAQLGGRILSGVPQVGRNLEKLVAGSRFTPSQTFVDLGKAEGYAARMKAGQWNWNDPANKIIVDSRGTILSGHHRIVGARLAGIEIPASGIYTSGIVQTPEKIRSWTQVIFE